MYHAVCFILILCFSSYGLLALSRRLFTFIINPLSIYVIVWTIVYFLYILLADFLPHVTYSAMSLQLLGHLAYAIACIAVSIYFRVVMMRRHLAPKHISYINNINLQHIVILGILCGTVINCLDLYKVINIAGSFDAYLRNMAYVRQALLARSDIPQFTLLNSIIIKILSLTYGMSLICAGIYFERANKAALPLMCIILSIVHSIILMNRLGAIVDIFLLLWAYHLSSKIEYKHYRNKAECPAGIVSLAYSGKAKLLFISAATTLIFVLLIAISLQRNYLGQQSPFPCLPTPIAKTVGYLVGPVAGFNVLVSQCVGGENMGASTLRPILKWLISLDLVDRSTLPPFFAEPMQIGNSSINVFTWFGVFYQDLGMLGIITIPFLFGLLCSVFFFLAKNHSSIFMVAMSCVSTVTIFLSFFDYFMQQAYYFILPFYCLITDFFISVLKLPIHGSSMVQQND